MNILEDIKIDIPVRGPTITAVEVLIDLKNMYQLWVFILQKPQLRAVRAVFYTMDFSAYAGHARYNL